MAGPAGDPRDETIGALVGRLVEDGRAYAEAELDLVKAIARHRAGHARKLLIGFAGALFLISTATTALVVGAVLSLGLRIGPMWAGVAVAAPLLIAALLLIRWGMAALKGVLGDKDERSALSRGGGT